ncbi:8961_t:CDS:10 [Diversispora eburnea]|uniref:Sister chromatid cohesion protein n=1 Tax=Diversispora eburnea TaxID=1213867 RepID=A0A9N8WHC6_9GLOM|nr:8961_t:CDS:10 [Diversispora eburnea]
MKDIPSISIAFEEFSTCNTAEPEYARIANMLENQASSQFADLTLQQQLHAVRNLLNQVDISRFKSPSVPFPQPSFEYAFCPQPSVPQKRQFTQVMDIMPQDNTMGFNRNIYQISGMDSLSQPQRYPEFFNENEIPQLYPQKNPDPSPSQIYENQLLLSPKVIITNETNDVTKRLISPEVFIEIPSRDVLAEYRSTDDLRNISQRKTSQEFKKQRERDRDEERNGESALNKLINYINTIFEAEDSIISEISSGTYSPNSTSLLVPSSINSNEPLLSSTVIRQLTKLVGKVSRYKRLEDADIDDLSRLLKILERSVREVETYDVLPPNGQSASLSGSHIKQNEFDSMNLDDGDDKMNKDNSYIQEIEDKLEKIISGIEAAIAAFSIMTDLITSSLNLIKSQLVGVVYRIFEMNVSDDTLNTGILPIVTNYLQKLYDLMHQEELSDAIVITVSFISIGPFFVDSMSGNNNSIFGNGLEVVKLVALGLLRLIFTKHQKQRTWILEEILTSLIKLPDGKSIQMVSALILQLVQSCTAGTNHINCKTIDDQRDAKGLEGDINKDQNGLRKCGGVWKIGIDAASTNQINRCTKTVKNSNESEYRILLDNFMEDVITVLNYPEWPAAEMIVLIFNKIMIGYINDKKADTYTKSMAIDYLGTIAGRIKKFTNSGILSDESSGDNWRDKDERDWLYKIKDIPKGEITTHTRIQSIKNLCECQKAVLNFLEIGATEDPGVQCARQFYLSEWGYSLANTLQLINEKRSDQNEEDKEEKIIKKLLDKIIVEYWKISSDDHIIQSLEQRSQGIERSDILLITELLATRQSLYQNFDSILSRILVSLDTGVVAFRTKALRALGQVVVCDPNILSQVNVRQTIAQRLSDNSPAVRDAAIDLVGRYLSQKPEITEQYYRVISDRVLELALKTVQELWLSLFKHQKNVNVHLDGFEDEDERQSEFNYMSAVGKKEVLSRSLLIVGVAGRLGERNGHVMGGFFKKVLEKDDKQRREVLNICQCIVDCLFEHLLTLQDSNSKSEVVSCISTICLLSSASPTLVANHVVTLQPYLKSASTPDDQSILYYVLIIYRNVLPLLKRPNPIFLNELETALIGLLTKSPQKILQEVVPCLCVIIDKLTFNYARLTKLLRSCIEKLKLEKKQLEIGKVLSSARNVMVLLLIIGLLCKNFDFDKKRAEQPEKMKDLNTIDKGPIVAIIFQLVLYFCKDGLSEMVQKMALQSLGFIYLSYPIIMLRPESTDLMDRILNTGAMDMKIQLMKVFLDFLVAEQQKINSDLEDKKNKKNIPVDLKVLIGNADEFAEAGVSSSLMQRYLDRILECTFDQTQSLKIVALDVLGNIIQQGLAHPVLCMPTIVAMETSPESNIRDKAFKLHQHLNEKHASLIHSRNVDCVRKAYAFQKQIANGKPVVGYAIHSQEEPPEALLNSMYSLLKDKRKSRNDFLISVVKTFDFDLKKCEETKVDIGFCKFVAENLATIDYKTIEEVLHVIYLINRVLSVVAISVLHSIQKNTQFNNMVLDNSGDLILDNVRVYIENKIPENFTESNTSSTNDAVVDVNKPTETIFYEASSKSSQTGIESKFEQYETPTQDTTYSEKDNILSISYAAKVSICMAILMYLKEHLKKSYSLSEAGTHKDKLAIRNQIAPLVISWEGLPYLDKPLNSDLAVFKQCELFKKLMAEQDI